MTERRPTNGWQKPPAEVPRDTSLDSCAPRVRSAVTALMERMIGDGFDPIVAESLRTAERQEFLYGFGRRYDDGRGIVTKAPTALKSWHGFGLAVDLWSKGTLWNASSAFWDALGRHAPKCELDWGGHWLAVDLPHVQWGWCPTSPTVKHVALLTSGGLEAVWADLGAA